MKKTKRFVFDTNTLISSSLFRNAVPRKAVNLAIKVGTLATSLETYEEFREVFTRLKFDKYLSLPTRLDIIDELKAVSSFHEVSITITGCRDPKDNKFLELAVAAAASCIITGDEDLMVLHPFRGIPILNAAGFLNSFSITL